MSDERESPQESDEQQADTRSAGHQDADTLKAVSELVDHTAAWLRQLSAAGGELATLLRLEWQLTLGDARRMLLLALLLVPLMLFTWLLFNLLLGWLIWQASGQVAVALLGVLALHVLGIALLLRQLKRYRESLGFRRTQAHLKRLMQGAAHETSTADSRD
jgi:uncharacterized membrane protein YqjE